MAEIEIEQALKNVTQRMKQALLKRPEAHLQIPPRLVAVSKTKPPEMIITAYNNGQKHFGENYIQELESKGNDSNILEQCKEIKWHFIGNLQRNKINKLLNTPNLFMVETVDSKKLATALNTACQNRKRETPLSVMVQINTSGEETKNGCDPEEAGKIVKIIRDECPNLKLEGLMTIGAYNHDLSKGPNPDFQKLLQCQKKICEEFHLNPADLQLSMGMSNDFEHAIEVGSSSVRVGSLIFGARTYVNKGKGDNPETTIGTGLSRIRHMECADAYVNVLKSWKYSYPKEIHFVITKKALLDKIQATFACHFPLVTVTPQSRNSKASSGGLLQDNHAMTHAVQTNNSAMAATSGAMAEVRPMDVEMSDTNDSCPICLCDFTDKKTLDKCGHSFCSACIDHSFSAVGPYCPVCQTVYGKIIGQQPPGTMSTKKEKRSLPGFLECNLYKVEYEIPSGIQEKCHPNPGKRFYGAKRTAYLPSNKEGETVLKMLQKAFEQKLIFTVGDSRTTNMTDVVTWNDIHHKTNILGGPSRYGYPDPDYLNRVSLELETKGITPADVFGQKIKPKISN
ncbi:yggS [Acanthosepion pharaonis]|uniref:Pyridoxal phosphate homeostasis protein n=1 Tax=Acanthosepion pharaonis TaxID=158019 RepID=A0A812CYZ2_ACAPH|nr:yggS [Sepia pharaonis]